ncbi:helix-turn-helix domain-containing protein [Gryllotalpicola protaetiae]|uniref:DNA-binding protein n=1 Tax=Gryllotalpicola protaetiae TaxID=2419771 RepID=A0A387BQU5_9MICO|nr:helix-turn-helix domain-containing protein [Gryllotalpicola protaetiae]AYG03400.1 DNA-binding protein [Gryllotalpicola protaetiae]
MTSPEITCIPSLDRRDLRVVVHPVAVDTETAAVLLGISSSQLRAHLWTGEITAYYSGTKPLFTFDCLRRFLEGLASGPSESAASNREVWFAMEPLSVDQKTAAALCGMSYSQFCKHVRAGHLGKIPSGNKPLFTVDELRRFVASLPRQPYKLY